jgi:hypothetical protein
MSMSEGGRRMAAMVMGAVSLLSGAAGCGGPAAKAKVDPVMPPPPSCQVPAAAQAESIATPTTVVGDGSAASCTAAALQAAVTTAGVIIFDCGADPITIHLTQQITINNQGGPDKLGDTLIDGGGKVTLDGGQATRILYLNACQPPYNSDHCDTFEHPHLTVQNLSFTGGNVSDPVMGGGAIFANGGRLKVVGCTFSDNHCAAHGNELKGGAIDTFLQSQVDYIVGSAFSGNSCESGGALGSIDTSYTVINSALSGNQATDNGGAIANDGDRYDLVLCGTTLADNTAGALGGGLFYVSNAGVGTTTIDNSTVSGNSSTGRSHSGGLYLQGTAALIRDSTISGNSAAFAAGVFVFPNAAGNSIDLLNVTLSGNQGSALEIDDAILGTLVNSTIAANTNGIGSGAMVALRNTIVAGNSGGNCSGKHTGGGGNLEFPQGSGSGCSDDVVFADPQLGPLGDNGGPAHTLTMLPAATSPAVGAGRDCPAIDQRGGARAAQGCTSGAVEVE